MNPTLQKLKGKNQVKFVTKDSDEEYEWVLKPIPFTLLLENFDKFQGLPSESDVIDGENMSQDQAAKLQKSIYPMMKAIIPKCIVSPTVVIGDAVGEDELSVDDIPFNSVVEIFNKIVEITGLDSLGDANRKKLQTQQSVKV